MTTRNRIGILMLTVPFISLFIGMILFGDSDTRAIGIAMLAWITVMIWIVWAITLIVGAK